MEVTSVNGKKFLDSKNANYSFGTLQKILETALAKTDLTNVNSVLILGMGGGSVIHSLRKKFKYQGKILAVEWDKKIIEIARDEFSIFQFENLVVENEDAFDFVNHSADKFDLIIIDLFIDTEVPPKFYSMDFIEKINLLMSSDSSLIFNLGIGERSRDKRNAVIEYFKNISGYSTLVLEKIQDHNTLLIVHKSS